MKTLSQLILSLSLVAAVPALAADDADAEITVYGKGSVPLQKPSMQLNVPDYDLSSQVYVFPTGLQILMQSDRSHPIVSVMTIVDHGSGDDFEGKEGLAHFVEHTWFRSKHTFVEPITGKEKPLPPIMDQIQDMTGMFNATTRNDWTDYRTVASTEFIDTLMQMESWRLTEPYIGVTAEEIAVETEVITNEWRRRNEQNYALLFNYLSEAVYPDGHPYKRSSTKESLDAIELEDLQSYFDKYYRPDTTTIVVVGDFDPLEASSLIFANMDWKLLDPELDPELDRWVAPKPGIENPDPNNRDHWLIGAYDPKTRGQENRARYSFIDPTTVKARLPTTPDNAPLPELGTKDILEREAPVDDTMVVVGWALPGGFRDDHVAYQALGNFLNFFMQPVNEFPGMEFQGCMAQPEKVNTTFACFVAIDEKKVKPEQAAEKVVDQVSTLMDPMYRPLLENSFSRGRNEQLKDVLHSIDLVASHFGGRADDLAQFFHYTTDAKVHSGLMGRVMNQNAQVIANMAYKYLKRDNYATILVRPLDEDEKDVAASGSGYAGASEGDSVIEATQDLADYDKSQIADSFVKPQLAELQENVLPNGMRIVVLPHSQVPVAEVSLIIGGGTAMEPDGIYDFYNRFHDAEQDDALKIAGSWGGANYAEAERISIRASSGNADGAMWMLRHYVDTIKPDTNGLVDWSKRGKKGLKTSWTKESSYHANAMTYAHLFPNHPKGKETELKDYDLFLEWGKPKLQEVIDKRFTPKNATLLVVGNIDADKALDDAFKIFSSWKAAPEAKPFDWEANITKPEMPTESGGVLIFDEEGRTQSQVSATCRLNYDGPEEDAALRVLSSLIGNETFKSLRVKEGLAYSPGAFAFSSADGSAALTFRALATNAGVGRVVEFVNNRIAEGEAGDFDDKEVTLHKLRSARADGVGSQSVSQMTSTLSEPIRKGLPWDHVTTEGDRLAAVDAKQLQKLMQGCGDNLIVTIEGPEKVLKDKLAEKNIEYTKVDWEARGEAMYKEQDPKGYKKYAKAKAKAEKKKAKDGEDESSDESSEASEATE